jgi:hypothetical protein
MVKQTTTKTSDLKNATGVSEVRQQEELMFMQYLLRVRHYSKHLTLITHLILGIIVRHNKNTDRLGN